MELTFMSLDYYSTILFYFQFIFIIVFHIQTTKLAHTSCPSDAHTSIFRPYLISNNTET
jgi:hypothetical protein